MRRGEYRELSRVTFADYAADWIDTYRGRTSRGFGDSARDDYRGALDREAIPFFGRMRLVEIEPRDLKRFLSYLEAPQSTRDPHPRQGLAIASVRKTVAPVRALLATAVEEGLLRSNPAAGLRIARPVEESTEIDDSEEVKALTEDELRLFLDQLPDAWQPFFAFLAQTGLRIGEAIELRWRDGRRPVAQRAPSFLTWHRRQAEGTQDPSCRAQRGDGEGAVEPAQGDPRRR